MQTSFVFPIILNVVIKGSLLPTENSYLTCCLREFIFNTRKKQTEHKPPYYLNDTFRAKKQSTVYFATFGKQFRLRHTICMTLIKCRAQLLLKRALQKPTDRLDTKIDVLRMRENGSVRVEFSTRFHARTQHEFTQHPTTSNVTSEQNLWDLVVVVN